MRRLLASAIMPIALLATSALHAQTDATAPERVVPTIPESQLEPAAIVSPYQFLSVSTSADEFVIDAAALAKTNSTDADIQAMAADLSAAHTALIAASQEAAAADKVDIAEPSLDGEQTRLLTRLGELRGEEFDRLYLQSNLFVYQRTIGYYRGYDDAGSLGAFVDKTVPELEARYASLVETAGAKGLAAPQEAPATD